MTQRLLWLPNRGPQAAFLSSTAREVMYGGAAGGGKTDALIALPLYRTHHPKHRCLMLRRTRPALQEVIDRTLQIYPEVVPGAVWKEAESRWKFPSGAIIQMGYAEHEKDILNYKCLTPGHEVLTRNGWKLLESMEVGEEVLTPNGFESIEETVTVPFKGDLVVADGAIKFRATPNHRFWTAQRGKNHWREKTADQLNRSDMIQTDGPDIGVAGTAFDELMGWLISEGGGKIGRAYTISQHKPEGRKAIIAACIEAGISFRVDAETILVWFVPPHWNTSSKNFIHGKSFYDVPEFGNYADEKFIPRSLTPSHRLLRGLLLGDGCQTNTNSWIYTTCSKQLAMDVEELAIQLGYTTRASQRGERHWQVSIFKSPDGARNLPVLKREAYDGLVHCIKVPSSYFFVKYQDGTVHVTGNTFEYDLICFDELTTFTEQMYLFMFLRNRTKSADLPPLMRSGTNPGDIGHEWVFRRFLDKRIPYKVYEDYVEIDKRKIYVPRQFIPSRIWDNPAMANRDEYIAGIMQMPAEDVAAYLYGEWSKLAGAMFTTIATAPVNDLMDKDYFIVRAIDFGIVDPTCVLWLAHYPKSGLTDIVSELYMKEPSLDDVAKAIKERESILHMRPPLYSVGSPEMFNRQATSNQSIATMLGAQGVNLEKGNTDLTAGWSRIRTLQQRMAIRVWPGQPGDVRWGAPNLCRTLPNLQRDTGLGKDPNKLRGRQEDHAADALRYGMMVIYERPAAVEKEEQLDDPNRDNVFDKVMADLKKNSRRTMIPELGDWG